MSSLPGPKRPLREGRETAVWDAAYASAYAQLILRAEPSIDRHGCARDAAKLIADAALEGYRELTRAKAGRAWARGTAASVGEEPDKPPILTP